MHMPPELHREGLEFRNAYRIGCPGDLVPEQRRHVRDVPDRCVARFVDAYNEQRNGLVRDAEMSNAHPEMP